MSENVLVEQGLDSLWFVKGAPECVGHESRDNAMECAREWLLIQATDGK